VRAQDRAIARRAFASPEWSSAADAIFKATGISVRVITFGVPELLSGEVPCAYCYVATGLTAADPETCFDSCPKHDAGQGRVICRAGLPALYAPIVHGDDVVAHVVVSGYVTSTRERRGRYEKLLSRGVSEEAARRNIKTLPIIARAQAESYLQMALACAHTVFDATLERVSSSERIEELKLFVSAGQNVVSADTMDAESLGGIAEEAVALVGGEAGAILRSRGKELEVVARTTGWRGQVGAIVSRASTASGRALETHKVVVAPGRDEVTATLALPLVAGGRSVGVLEVRLAHGALPIPPEKLSRLGRFGQFIAIALEREDERVAVQRAMTGYGQLNELAADLGGQTDVEGVAHRITGVLEKAFEFQIAGLVLTGWGRDRADVVAVGEVAALDIDHVLGIVSGRDVEKQAFDKVRFVMTRGSIVEKEPAEDWALSAVELQYGALDVGWLFVARSDGARYSAQDRALLEGIAAHAGSAFGRAALFSRIRDDYATTIAALSATLDAGEHGPSGHAGRVMDYAMLIGEEMGLGYEDIEKLRFAGLLHDVGKTGVPEEILLKPGKLTPEELLRAQGHSEIGASIIDQIGFLKSLTPIILHHHERWDGSGYPAELAGEDIPRLSRILALADAFDAMTAQTPYRAKMTIAQARTEVEAGAGTQFDPQVVEALIAVLERMARAGSTGLLLPEELRSTPDLPA